MRDRIKYLEINKIKLDKCGRRSREKSRPKQIMITVDEGGKSLDIFVTLCIHFSGEKTGIVVVVSGSCGSEFW